MMFRRGTVWRPSAVSCTATPPPPTGSPAETRQTRTPVLQAGAPPRVSFLLEMQTPPRPPPPQPAPPPPPDPRGRPPPVRLVRDEDPDPPSTTSAARAQPAGRCGGRDQSADRASPALSTSIAQPPTRARKK